MSMPPPPPPPSPYYSSTALAARRSRFPNNDEQEEQQQQQRLPNNNVKYEERDYEEIYYHFDDYSRDIILADFSKFKVSQGEIEHYEAEDLILEEAIQGEIEGMKKSFLFGLGCGLVGFNLLRFRRGRGIFGGGMTKSRSNYSSSSASSNTSRSNSTGGYTFDPLPPTKSNSTLNHQLQHHQHASSGGGGGSHNSNNSRSGLLFDTILGTVFGLETFFILMESDTFYPTTTTDGSNTTIASPPPQWTSPIIPLVPGRSVISETLCGPLTEEFRKFPKALWQSGNSRGIENGYNNHMALYANSGWKGSKYYGGNDNAEVVSLGENGNDGNNGSSGQEGLYEHLVLDNLQGFIINCERRSRHEERLRKIRGLRQGSKLPVVIPGEGVSAEDDLELDDVYFVGRDDDDDDTGFGL